MVGGGADAFDYVIVGGGTAGCVLAARLSEDPQIRVLLLEAGPEPTNPWIKIPVGLSRLFTHPVLNWRYSTQPEPRLENRAIYLPRGKTLGGCSAINGMAYLRGQPEDYDGWRDRGNPGWGWADVQPYFRRLERFRPPAGAHAGQSGPLTVSGPAYVHPISRAFIETGIGLGLAANDDLNSDQRDRIGFLHFTIDNGVRASAAEAYLRPARRRHNLAVETGALTRRILLDGRRAVGVEYGRGGTVRRAMARREVILAAGAVNSPQLLMLSGIGPADQLQAHGIPVVAALPGVGANLQDHVYIHGTCRTTPEASLNPRLRGPWLAWQGARYLLAKSGPLTMGASQACALLRGLPGATRPDLQMNFRPMSFRYDRQGRIAADPDPGITIAFCHLQPQSRGTVTLASAKVEDQPVIRANYLSAAPDEDAMVAGIGWMRRFFRSEPLKSQIVLEDAPAANCRSDDEVRAFVRRSALTMCHPVGTCRMGDDSMAVVDATLKVRGVESLRLIDASIMPVITSAGPAPTVFMIGEKGADLVKSGA